MIDDETRTFTINQCATLLEVSIAQMKAIGQMGEPPDRMGIGIEKFNQDPESLARGLTNQDRLKRLIYFIDLVQEELDLYVNESFELYSASGSKKSRQEIEKRVFLLGVKNSSSDIIKHISEETDPIKFTEYTFALRVRCLKEVGEAYAEMCRGLKSGSN